MNNYWIDFWKDYSADISNKGEQTQVLRTFNKKPIDKATWEFTLKTIQAPLNLVASDDVLELCCGNGLISQYISSKVKSVMSVDVSKELIDELRSKNIGNIHAVSSDIRTLEVEDNKFDKIIIYAGIQYLDHSETIVLIKNIFSWLKPNGIVLLGDIPDSAKLWEFYNSDERESVFFDHCENNTDVVGTWFEKAFFEKLSKYAKFASCRVLEQNDKLIYSSFRYDFVAHKGDFHAET